MDVRDFIAASAAEFPLDTSHRARWQESPPYLARMNRKARRERS
jgi:hypothetical protein